MVGIHEGGSDSVVFYDAGANPASTEILASCSNTPPLLVGNLALLLP